MNEPRKILSIICLAGLGVLGNYFTVPMFFGVEVIFGSIFVMIAILNFGTTAGVLVAIAAGSCTWVLWGHPYALCIFVAEAIFVCWAYSRTQRITAADALFWVILGMPLVFLFYVLLLNLNFETAAVIAIKQSLNGIFNSIIARITDAILNIGLWRRAQSKEFEIRSRPILFNVVVLIGLVSAAVPSFQGNRVFLHELEIEVGAEFNAAGRFVTEELKIFTRSSLAESMEPEEAYKEVMDSLVSFPIGGETLTAAAILSDDGEVVRSFGELISLNEAGRTRSVSDGAAIWLPIGEMAELKRWRAGRYVHEEPVELAGSAKGQLILELDTTTIVDRYEENKVAALVTLSIVTIIVLGIGQFISIWLTQPLSNLQRESGRLATVTTEGESISISRSPILEINAVGETLQTAAIELAAKFLELDTIRGELAARVDEQTQEVKRLATVARQVSNGVVITDRDGAAIWVNEGFSRLTGFAIEELIGRKPGHLLQGPDTDPDTIRDMSNSLATGQPFSVEILNYTKDKKPYWVAISCTPMTEDDGTHAGFIAIETDIQERKLAEIALQEGERELQEQLKKTVAARSQMEKQASELALLAEREAGLRTKAEGAEKTKAEFLASMSHEIRTPMTGISGFADLLMDDDLPSQSRHKVEKIKDLAASLLTIINDILDLSKLDAGKFEIVRTDFDPSEIANDVTQLFHQTCPPEKKANLAITSKMSPDFPRGISADPSRLRQVLINLMGNAVKFTDAGSVTLHCGKEPDRDVLRFRVVDTGIGIDREAKHKLFGDFVQADASISRKYQGTGLGLAICKRLVELMGGEVGIESVLGEGSTFWFTLPYDPLPEGVEITSASSTDQKTISSVRPLSILVAEDNEINQTIIRALLDRMDHECTFANNGAEAVEAVMAHEFDLILMDVRMPEMSGPDATKHIRSLPGSKGQIPIIALTADIMAENRQSYFDAGMNDCVGKPINHEELAVAINKAVGETVNAINEDESSATNGPAFNLEETTSRLGLPEEVIAPLLAKFVADYEDVADRIQKMADEDDFEGVRDLAHAVKGVSASLGMVKISQQATKIEREAKAKNATSVQGQIEFFAAATNEAITAIETYTKNA